MSIPTGDIKLIANFELNTNKALDSRLRVSTYSQLAELVSAGIVYPGLTVWVDETANSYIYKGETNWTRNLIESSSIDIEGDITASNTQLNSINWSTPTNSAIGFKFIGTVGETVSEYSALFISSSGKWHIADNLSSSKVPCRALALQSGIEDSNIWLFNGGYAQKSDWTFEPGATIYLAQGEITGAQPTISGSIIQSLGYSLNFNTVYLDFNSFYLELEPLPEE